MPLMLIAMRGHAEGQFRYSIERPGYGIVYSSENALAVAAHLSSLNVAVEWALQLDRQCQPYGCPRALKGNFAAIDARLESIKRTLVQFRVVQSNGVILGALASGDTVNPDDAIFVRDMKNVITCWNRGAEALYGWRSNEALGKVTHALLQTEFPAPTEEITAELIRTGRFEDGAKGVKHGSFFQSVRMALVKTAQPRRYFRRP